MTPNGLKAEFYRIDQKTPAIPPPPVAGKGSTLKMSITQLNGTYEGQLQQRRQHHHRRRSQGQYLPLVLIRAHDIPRTTWTIPTAPAGRIINPNAEASRVQSRPAGQPSDPSSAQLGINVNADERYIQPRATRPFFGLI